MAFLPVRRISPVSVIPPLLITDIRLTATVIRRTSGRSLGVVKKKDAFRDVGERFMK